MTPGELTRSQDLFSALAGERAARVGHAATFDELLERVRGGRASLADFGMLLALLSADDEASVAGRASEALDELLRTTRPDDGEALRRIAMVYANTGHPERAAALFRWCATRSDAGPVYFSFNEGGATRVSAQQLVKDVKEGLEGDLRLQVIEQILEWADPGDNAWARGTFDDLALTTWAEVLGPAAALERTRDLCESLMAPLPGEAAPALATPEEIAARTSRREPAKTAARLYAHAGELEPALRCLETALVRTEVADGGASGGAQVVYLSGGGIVTYYGGNAFGGGGGGSLGLDDIAELFPYDASALPAPLEWMVGAAERIGRWAEEERIDAANAAQTLCVLSLRLDRLGARAEASRALDLARAAASVESARDRLLWVSDVARRLDRPELAVAIERELFDRQRLLTERIPDVVEHVAATAGPAAAIELGAAAMSQTHHPRLLDHLAAAAAAVGRTDDADTWSRLAKDVRDAEQALADRRERLRREAQSP